MTFKQLQRQIHPSKAPWNEVLKSSIATKCTGMQSTKSHVEAVGKHLQLETQPCTNVCCNFSSKLMTVTAGDPVTNCIISLSLIPGTPEKELKNHL